MDDVRRCAKKLDERVIVVVYRPVGDTRIIITAYLSTKIQKYLP